MDFIYVLILFASLYLGWDMGANNAGNAMSTLVGSNTVGYGKAIWLVIFFVLLGAVFQSEGIATTVGKGIVPPADLMSNSGAVLSALLATAIVITLVTILKMPTSTTQAMVGSIAGAGIALGIGNRIDFSLIGKIGLSWVLAPIGSCILALIIYRVLITPLSRRLTLLAFDRTFRILSVVGAIGISYNLGATCIGIALGPLVGMDILDRVRILGFEFPPDLAGALGIGIAFGIGALMLGGGVTATLGRKITVLGPAMAFTAQLSATAMIYPFVLMGIPVSVTHTLVGAIVGVGLTKGMQTVRMKTITYIVMGWVFTPIVAGLVSVVIYKLFLIH